MADLALRVESAMPQLAEHLYARTEEVFKRLRCGSSPEMFTFGRVSPSTPTSEFYRDFADRLNQLVCSLDGKTAYPDAAGPCVDAALAPAMLVPLADGRWFVTTYLFVYDLPFWTFANMSATFDNEAARVWLNEHVGHLFVVCREGDLPVNSEDRT